MSQLVILGPDAKVEIAGLPFRVVAGKLLDSSTDEETTDTDSEEAAREFFSDRFTGLEIDLEAQLDISSPNADDLFFPNVGMFVDPFVLVPGQFVHVIIWPEGKATEDETNWEIKMLVRKASPGWRVIGSVPQTVSVTGIASGPYHRPYESNSRRPRFDVPSEVGTQI